MSVHELDLVLLVGALVVLVAIVAVRLSVRTGLPFLVLFVGLGLLLGPEGPLGLHLALADLETARALGYAALLVILVEGGLTTRWTGIRPVLAPAALLATVGVVISAAVTGLAAMALLGLPFSYAIVLGAVLAPTDSAAVFAVLRRVPLPHRLAGLLEAESGGNDAVAVLLVVSLSGASELTWGSGIDLAGLAAYELAAGLVIGLVVAKLAALGLHRVALPAAGLYPLAVTASALLAYALAAIVHGSGFLAVYVAALTLGNARLPHRPPVRAFAEGLAWMAQIMLFVMLGLLVRPSQLGDAVLPAIAIGSALLLVARPISVAVCLAPFRTPWRDAMFVSLAGLRGAVPIVLAIIPVVEGLPDAKLLFDTVFVLVVLFTLLQSPLLPQVAARLGLVATAEAHAVDVETVPLLRLGTELLELHIPPHSRLHGVEVFELGLPPGSAVSLIVRDGTTMVPTPYTRLEHGDDVLLVTPYEHLERTEARLRSLAAHGRLGAWYSSGGRTGESLHDLAPRRQIRPGPGVQEPATPE